MTIARTSPEHRTSAAGDDEQAAPHQRIPPGTAAFQRSPDLA